MEIQYNQEEILNKLKEVSKYLVFNEFISKQDNNIWAIHCFVQFPKYHKQTYFKSECFLIFTNLRGILVSIKNDILQFELDVYLHQLEVTQPTHLIVYLDKEIYNKKLLKKLFMSLSNEQLPEEVMQFRFFTKDTESKEEIFDKTIILMSRQEYENRLIPQLDILLKNIKQKMEDIQFIKSIILSKDENLYNLYTEQVIKNHTITEDIFWNQVDQYKQYLKQYVNNIEQTKYKESNVMDTKYQIQKEVNLSYIVDSEKYQDMQQENTFIDSVNQETIQLFHQQIHIGNTTRDQMEEEQANNQQSVESIKRQSIQFKKKENFIINNQEKILYMRQASAFTQFFNDSMIKFQGQQSNKQSSDEKQYSKMTRQILDRIPMSEKDELEIEEKQSEFEKLYKQFNFKVTELLKWYYQEMLLEKEENKEIQNLRIELSNIRKQLEEKCSEIGRNLPNTEAQKKNNLYKKKVLKELIEMIKRVDLN